MGIKKILVPVDFSDRSAYALEVAARLVKDSNGHIIVLHMLGLSEAILTKDEAQEFMEAKFYMKLAKKHFAEFLDKDYLKGVRISEMVQNYRIFGEINTVAHEQGVELIVMGSHGTSGLGDFFVGSNTEKVVRSSDFPVLVIKEKRPDFKIGTVVMGSDFKVESVPVYQRALKVLRTWNVKIHLVYINLPQVRFKSTAEIKKEVDTFMKVAHHGDIPNDVSVACVNDYSVEEGLYHCAQEWQADLIALPTHGRRGLSHFFQGSIGEDLANHAHLPIMTFKM